jgi:NAD(P)-dependent dehydrogenase (short-subunit alcohol dehydrogenase family)
MSRIFVTGSADGLGRIAAKILTAQGHRVVLHARNAARGREAMKAVPGAETVLTADLSDLEEIKRLAEDANASGNFDAVIHNAGVYRISNAVTFMVNSLAPYMLTCMIRRPNRLIYLSSGLHMQGKQQMDTNAFREGRFNYSDTKLHMVLLAKAIARKWLGVYANAVNPGWVPTKMGGAGAPDDLQKGAETQAWLAISNDPDALVSGRYFFHKKEKNYLPLADNISLQEDYLKLCEQITGIRFPEE